MRNAPVRALRPYYYLIEKFNQVANVHDSPLLLKTWMKSSLEPISSPNVDAIKRRLSPRPEKVVPKEPIEVDTKNNKVFNL